MRNTSLRDYRTLPRSRGRGLPIPVGAIDADKFWGRVNRSAGDVCWGWAGTVTKGYGTFRFVLNGKPTGRAAHRVAYTLLNGPIPQGLEIDHLCRNTLCVNPEHLEAVTPQINTARSGGVTSQWTGNWTNGICGNGHDLSAVGLHKSGRAWTCAQCGRDRVRTYKQRKAGHVSPLRRAS